MSTCPHDSLVGSRGKQTYFPGLLNFLNKNKHAEKDVLPLKMISQAASLLNNLEVRGLGHIYHV